MSAPTHPLQVRDYRLIWLARFINTAATTAMVVVIIGVGVYPSILTDVIGRGVLPMVARIASM